MKNEHNCTNPKFIKRFILQNINIAIDISPKYGLIKVPNTFKVVGDNDSFCGLKQIPLGKGV